MDRFPKKNMTAKILAVIFAIILWIFVMNEQNPPIEMFFQAPLEVRNLSGSLVANDTPDYVRVKIRGPRSVVAGMSQQDIKAYVDLKGLTEGENIVKVHTSVPANLEVVEVVPDKLAVNLDTLVSRQLPVEVRTTGTPAPGSNLRQAAPSLTTVRVDGPRHLMDALERVVAYVDISGKKDNFTVEVQLAAINAEGKSIEKLTINPRRANVSVALTGASKKVVDIKTIIVNETPKNVLIRRITTAPERVEIYGDANLVDKVDAVFTDPISMTNIDKATDIEVKLQLKEGITAKNNTVTVHIEVEKKQ